MALPKIDVIEQSKSNVVELLGTTDMPKGLVAIKALLGNARLKASFVYNRVLNHHQRAVLCYTAKLNRSALDKTFQELNNDERLAIQKAVLQLDKIYNAFNKVNAISPKLFLECGYADSEVKGIRS
ncbi:hypothetical protein Q4489_04210 [Thalassotalea sp. 1_MG-2023]|uniref:hypothetical protein n=1 Tax=Thalassotalea sp. 1_MG-2023 TaxID=3062680 RepID=UPI0026E3B8C7|nr:hypothetical protein [Thalassotalea sp. 1_MG-2023]MDO6426200.1 hypothetical protein [Thalassotalea sp. 1_MG-2023]